MTNEEVMLCIGDVSKLKNHADGTLIGNVKNLYKYLGGFSFVLSAGNNFNMVYDDTVFPIDVPNPPSEEATDDEKLKYITKIIGNCNVFKKYGHDNLVDTILDIYSRLNNLGFESIDNKGGIYSID